MSGRIRSVADFFANLREGSGRGQLGIYRLVSGALGAPLLVDSVTYKIALFIAPCDGCEIVQGKVTGAVAVAGGTSTLAFEKYDLSGSAGANVLSATNIDPTGVTSLEGLALTLSATKANLYMDEGDVLWSTLVCGTMSTDGEGYMAEFVILVPEIIE